METVMNEKGIRTIEQVRQFLKGTAPALLCCSTFSSPVASDRDL